MTAQEKWEAVKAKQAENIERLYNEHPDDWFYKAEMERPPERRTGFAPVSGICPYCRRNIADGDRAITVESLGDYIITGCPHCFRSYCD